MANDRLKKVEQKFWIPAKNSYAFGIGMDGKMNETASVEATVPMWFGLLDPQHSNAMIDQLASSHHSADWGMRIISDQESIYNPEGYHYGAVWPLFTGWAAVGAYRYHRPLTGYQNLRANAMLTLDGALGHTTEVLSGAFMQQHSISSPHQIWSAAMVLSPVLRGMMGLQSDTKTLTFAPHLPADWSSFALHQVAFGSGTVDLGYTRQANVITLTVSPNGRGILQFAPAVSPRAEVVSVEIDGKKAQYKTQNSATDKHVVVNVPLNGKPVVTIRLKNDFELSVPADLPALGSTSENIKPISETWTANQVEYIFEGLAGHTYNLPARNLAGAASLSGGKAMQDQINITFPPGRGYVKQTLVVRFK
jgi:hypothetical protein